MATTTRFLSKPDLHKIVNNNKKEPFMTPGSCTGDVVQEPAVQA
jgi:hypothetical protein